MLARRSPSSVSRSAHVNGFLNAGEGIASNVLSQRLERLEQAGILTKRPDPDDGRWYVYDLTAKGIALAPVLVGIVIWSADHEVTDAPPETVRAMRRDRGCFLADVRKHWSARVQRA